MSAGDGEARYAGRAMDSAKFLRKSAALKVEKYNLSDQISKLSWRYYNSTDHVINNFSLRLPLMMKMSPEVGSIIYGTRLSAEWQKDDSHITAALTPIRISTVKSNQRVGKRMPSIAKLACSPSGN